MFRNIGFPRFQVTDNDDGTYSVKYATAGAGSYSLSVSMNGQPIGGPVAVNAVTSGGTFSAGRSFVRGLKVCQLPPTAIPLPAVSLCGVALLLTNFKEVFKIVLGLRFWRTSDLDRPVLAVCSNVRLSKVGANPTQASFSVY